MSAEPTFWNGEPTPARKVSVIVADLGAFPAYWAKEYVGQRRDAVEVSYSTGTFYLDDEGHDGWKPGGGWAKVTIGGGSPRWGHRDLQVEPGSVEERQPADAHKEDGAP